MRHPSRRGANIGALVAVLAGRVSADELQHDAARAARLAVDPLPIKAKLNVEPGYTWAHDDTEYEATLLFEPWMPYEGALIPGLAIADLWSVARLQVTAESVQNANGTASGLQNLNFANVAAKSFGAWTLGAGFGTVFPLATSSQLGPAKWQLGPAVAFKYDGISVLTIAAFAQALWSVAGSDEVSNMSYVTVQPFISLFLRDTLTLKSDATMSFYWRGGSSTVPVGLGLGYAFSKHFVGTVKGVVTVAGDDQGTVEAQVELTFLP